MQVTFTSIEQPVDDLRFRLYPNLFCGARECGISVDSFFVGTNDLTDRVVSDSTDLHVGLPQPLNSPIDVAIYFKTVVPELAGRFGYFDRQYALETWFPMPAPLANGRWQKVHYTNEVEPVADFYDFVVNFEFPDSLQIIAPGMVSADTTDGTISARFEQADVHEFAMIVGKDYLADTLQSGSISLRVYYREADAFMADSVMKVADTTLKLMSQYVVAYPYNEYNVVIGGFVGGGLEVPLGTFLNRPTRVVWFSFYDLMVAHETIHQWFYGIINSSQAATPWLDESITEYFSWKVLADIVGDPVEMTSLAGYEITFTGVNRFAARQYIGLLPITEPADYYFPDEYFVTIYYKGVLLMRTFGALMGPENERLFWKTYGDMYQMRRPTTDEFIELASQFMPPPTDAGEVINMAQPLDFEMRSIKREVIDTLELDTTETGGPTESGPRMRSTVSFMARHPLKAPVTVRLIFQDDVQQDTTIVPKPGRNEIVVEGSEPVLGAVIDPDYVYAVDANLLNNALYPDVSSGAGLRLFEGLSYLVELLFGMAWGI